MTGTVTVRGATFTEVQLNYDIFQDLPIILVELKEGLMIKLLLSKDHTSSFSLNEHKFILLEHTTGNNIPEKQYFEILYSGRVSLFQRWVKRFEEEATPENPHGRYLNTEITRYILKDGKLQQFTNRFSLFRILAERKNELKKYLKNNSIHNVRKAAGQKIAGLIEYYNSIIP